MFVSNTGIGTSHNFHLCLEKGEKRTFRVYLRPEVYGSLPWRFRFHNTVDSTWDDGTESWADLSGGQLRIVSAAAGDSEIFLPISWHGEMSCVVEPRTWAVSDPVTINVPKDRELVFSWCLEALSSETVLPATPNSMVTTYVMEGEYTFAPNSALRQENLVVLPDAFETERADIRARMAFLGDSITQGCGTSPGCYEQWVARIADALAPEITTWNLGLGFGRAADAALGGAWLCKAAQTDVVNVCMGVNDLLHGSRDEGTLMRDLHSIVTGLRMLNPQVRVVLFTVPPFDWEGKAEIAWRHVNEAIRSHGFGADAVFDIATILGMEPPMDQRSEYGLHPDGRGCAAVADEYVNSFWQAHRNRLLI